MWALGSRVRGSWRRNESWTGQTGTEAKWAGRSRTIGLSYRIWTLFALANEKRHRFEGSVAFAWSWNEGGGHRCNIWPCVDTCSTQYLTEAASRSGSRPKRQGSRSNSASSWYCRRCSCPTPPQCPPPPALRSNFATQLHHFWFTCAQWCSQAYSRYPATVPSSRFDWAS